MQTAGSLPDSREPANVAILSQMIPKITFHAVRHDTAYRQPATHTTFPPTSHP